MSPTIPRNLRIGQIRRTIGLVTPDEFSRLGEDQRAAVDALSLHIRWRARQRRHPAFEGDETIVTVGWMRKLLRVAGARKTGARAAAAAIARLEGSGLMVDTGKVMTPARQPSGYPTVGASRREGREAVLERAAASLLGHSYWWRVFRVPALTRVRAASQTAYPRSPGAPLTPSGSLSALLRRQGLISGPRRRSRPNPGSPQWAFAHSGPP